jgi:hypothetical protein
MSSTILVNKFEISTDKDYNRNDIIYLVFKINNLNYFRFPYYLNNINILIKNFEDIINGKERDISLNITGDINNYNLIIFKKEYFAFSLLSKNCNLNQEIRLYFENNSLVRNALRVFIYES